MTEVTNLNQAEIKEYLPHRDPFLFLDSMTDIVKGESGIGHYQVTGDEDFFRGHFPGNPVFPGVILVEAMAQAAGVIGCHYRESKDNLIYFMAIDGVKFRRPVKPGDKLEFHVKRLTMRSKVWKFEGKTYANGELATEATLTAMIQSND